MLQAPAPAPSILGSWDQAVRLVRERSTSLRQAYARVELARGLTQQAWASALPQVLGQGTISRHMLIGEGPNPFTGEIIELPSSPTTWQATATLTAPLVALEAWNQIAVAAASAKAAELREQDAERLVLGSLARALVNALTAERLADVARLSLRATLANLELTKKRHEMGAATAVDVLRAEAEADVTRGALVSANEGIRKAREGLGLAVGEAKPWGVAASISFDSLPENARAACHPVGSLDERADLRALRQDVEAARKQTDSFALGLLPTLSATTGVLYSEPKSAVNNQSVAWTFGGILSWNLFDGGLRYGQRVANAAELSSAEQALTEEQRNAVIEVERARRDIAVAEASLAISRHAQSVAAKSAELARLAFANGSGTAFILVDETKRAREADLDVAVKEVQLVSTKLIALFSEANCQL